MSDHNKNITEQNQDTTGVQDASEDVKKYGGRSIGRTP